MQGAPLPGPASPPPAPLRLALDPPSPPCPQSKEEVMAVRLREADSMAAVAEMRQRIAELEIQVSGWTGARGQGDARPGLCLTLVP